MKIKTVLPFLALAALVLLVGLSCSIGNISTVTPPTDQPQVVQPTQPIPPTLPPQPATQPPQPVATEGPPDFFTEDFISSELPNWSYFLMSGDENEMSITTGDHKLTFDLEDDNIYVYLMYDPFIYTDVRLDARVDNRGQNNNNVSLICRYGNEGWYEFNVANNGLYWILAYIVADNKYQEIFSGGSTAIKMGRDVNDYTAICSGETLALYINGVEARTITEKTYKLREGQVGIGVSSFETLPIITEWDYVTISQP